MCWDPSDLRSPHSIPAVAVCNTRQIPLGRFRLLLRPPRFKSVLVLPLQGAHARRQGL